MRLHALAVLLGSSALACGSVRQEGPPAVSTGAEDGSVPGETPGADGSRPDADRADTRRLDGGAPPTDGRRDAAPPRGDGPPVRADGARSDAPDGAPPRPDAAPPPSPEELAFGCPRDPALRACYTFDGAANRLQDGSTFGNHGMLNSARVTPGVRGSALSFVAGNEFALVPPSPSLRVEGTGFTFEAWVRPTMSPVDSRVDFIAARWNIANQGFLFGSYAEELAINSSGGVGQRSTPTKIPLGRWSHVAVVAAPTGVLMYIQGTPIGPALPALTFVANDEPMTIGNRNPAQSPDPSPLTAFRGDIDVLRLYARVRTPAEICVDANRHWNGTACVDVVLAR